MTKVTKEEKMFVKYVSMCCREAKESLKDRLYRNLSDFRNVLAVSTYKVDLKPQGVTK